jgi:hypothetical protein
MQLRKAQLEAENSQMLQELQSLQQELHDIDSQILAATQPQLHSTGAGAEHHEHCDSVDSPGAVPGDAPRLPVQPRGAKAAYMVVRKVAVRRGSDMQSRRVGSLRPGQHIWVVEEKPLEGGVLRVRCAEGWITASRNSSDRKGQSVFVQPVPEAAMVAEELDQVERHGGGSNRDGGDDDTVLPKARLAGTQARRNRGVRGSRRPNSAVLDRRRGDTRARSAPRQRPSSTAAAPKRRARSPRPSTTTAKQQRRQGPKVANKSSTGSKSKSSTSRHAWSTDDKGAAAAAAAVERQVSIPQEMGSTREVASWYDSQLAELRHTVVRLEEELHSARSQIKALENARAMQ